MILIVLASFAASGQVSFRSEIKLGKQPRSRNIGINMITIGLGNRRYTSGVYERYSLIIDVDALRNPKRTYTYRQVAERVYGLTPGIPAGHLNQPWVPNFLLAEPPAIAQRTVPVVKVRR